MSVALQVADQTHHVRDTDDSRRVEVGIVVDRKDAMDACSSKLADDDRKSALTLDCDRGRRGLSNQSTNESVQAQRRARLHVYQGAAATHLEGLLSNLLEEVEDRHLQVLERRVEQEALCESERKRERG